jgi:hypothetical protein
MLRTISVQASVLALASGLAMATGPPFFQAAFAQGMPMGTMKTTNDVDDPGKAARPAADKDPQQAQAPERVTPTYSDTAQDRLMREKTDDGAHDPNDVKR